MRWPKIPSYEKLNSFLFLENEIKNDELKTAQNRNLPSQTIVFTRKYKTWYYTINIKSKPMNQKQNVEIENK